MRIRDDRIYKITWTAKAIGTKHAPDSVELIDEAGNVKATLASTASINVLNASRITAEYNTDEETDNTVDFTFDVFGGVIDPPDTALHDPYSTLCTAIAMNKAKSVPITPGPQWLKAALTIATKNMTAAKSVYLYVRVIQ